MNAFKRFLVNVVWPFFIKYIWPPIRTMFIDFLITMVNALLEKIMKSFNQNNQNYEDCNKRAETAEQNAEEAQTSNEKAIYEKIAQEWREMADNIRKENEELKNMIISQFNNTIKESQKHILENEPKIETIKDPKVIIDNKQYPLIEKK